MKEYIELTTVIPAPPEVVYAAWLDSERHSEMTGGSAECSDQIGAFFTAWDGYIEGQNLELVPNEKIVQTWRTSEFDETDEDSHLIIEFKHHPKGTLLTLKHSEIPEGQFQYLSGWEDHYFAPMIAYFGA